MLRRILILAVMIVLTAVSWAAAGPASSLDDYFAKLEQLAQEEGKIVPQGSGRFSQEVVKSQNLAESGKYLEAAGVLSVLLEEKMESDWRRMLTTRYEIPQKWSKTKVIELADYQRFYLNTGPLWFRKRARPIVALWKLKGVDETEKYKLLRDLLRNRGDRQGEKLVLGAIAGSRNSSSQDAAKALLEIGNQQYQAKQYNNARSTWLRVKGQFPNSRAWCEAIHNLGLLCKHQGDFAGAIRWFSMLMDVEANNLEPSGNFMKVYRNYKPDAQWEIANCLFAQKKYREALKAYWQTETKYPFSSWCGNAHAEFRYRYAFNQGLCHDWLNDAPTAVRLYFKSISGSSEGLYSNPVAHLRIVDIYEAGDQISNLENLFEEIDREHLARIRRLLSDSDEPSDEEILKVSPTRIIRRILKLRKMEAGKDWQGLVSLVKINDSMSGPEEANARRRNWEATEAARILAKHADATAPLLITRLKEVDGRMARFLAKRADATVPLSFARGEVPDRDDMKWLYYALGLCGTEEAVATLKSYALRETNSWWTSAVVYALSSAGKRGEAALATLENKADGNLKISITHYRQGRIPDHDQEIRFPELRKVSALPSTWDELKTTQPAPPSEADKLRR